MKLFRYRRPSLNTLLGITKAKKRMKKELGITDALKPFRFWTNAKRQFKRKIGYESDAGRLIRNGLPRPGGCLVVVLAVATAIFVTLAAIAADSKPDAMQGLVTVAPDENGTFTIQPQGAKTPTDAVKVATEASTSVLVAHEKAKVADLKAGMWARAEMVNGVATKIIAGNLWLEEGEKLVLFKGLPQELFTHPTGFDVPNVPTKFGTLRLVYRLVGNGSYLRWGRKALPKEGMVVCWPTTLKARFSFGQPVNPDDHGLIHLPADVSELRIWFSDPIVPQK